MLQLLKLFRFSQPKETDLARLLESQSRAPIAYSDGQRESRFLTAQRHEATLGSGDACWQRANQQLANWAMFPQPKFLLYPAIPAISTGNTVIVAMQLLGGKRRGLWICCACRITHTIDSQSAEYNRFGFTYQTLPNHVACGEETFLVTQEKTTGTVRYEIFSDSLPKYRFLYPLRPFIHALQLSVKRRSGVSMATATT